MSNKRSLDPGGEPSKRRKVRIFKRRMFDMREEDDVNFTKTRKMTYQRDTHFLSGHLKSAIDVHESELLADNPLTSFECSRHITIKRWMVDLNINHTIFQRCHSPHVCLRRALTTFSDFSKYLHPETLKYRYLMCVDNAIKHYRIHKDHYTQSFCGSNIPTVETLRLKLVQDTHLLFLYKRMVLVEEFKNRITFIRLIRGEMFKLSNNIMVDPDIILFKCELHGFSVGPTPVFMAALDSVQVRFNIVLYSILSDAFGKNPSSFETNIKKTISVIDEIQEILGIKIYKVLKTWESLVIGLIIKDERKDMGFVDLYNTAIEDITEALGSHQYLLPKIINQLTLSHLPKDNIHNFMRLELTGLCKHFGHPQIRIERLFAAVKKIGTEVKDINPRDVAELVSFSRKIFCQRYFYRHNHWPSGDYPKELKDKYVARARWVSDADEKKIDLAIWGLIKFKKVFNYDYFVDTTEILKDSAMSPDYNAWWTMYDQCAFKIRYGKAPDLHPNRLERRVMLRFLKGEEEECRKAVENAQCAIIDQANDICEICAKEGELNETGRGFIKQTYEQRLVQVSMEANIAKSLLTYYDEQTMTDSELQTLVKASSATRLMGTSFTNTNLDLMKWNITFRHELVKPFGEMLDELYGTGCLYADSHLWFLRTVALSNNRMCPPDYKLYIEVIDRTSGLKYFIPKEGEFSHLNHLGGYEGMHQKKWTFITIMVILFVADSLSLKVRVIGQGDNQVIFTKFAKHQQGSVKILQQRFLNMLAGYYAKIGLKIKPTETWYSSTVFEYGRERIIEGMVVPPSTKRSLSVISDVNDGYASFQTHATTIETSTESIARKDTLPDASFILYGFNVVIICLDDKYYS